MKKIFLTILICTFFFASFGQSLKFNTNKFTFPTIKKAGPLLHYTFTFENQGNDTLRITKTFPSTDLIVDKHTRGVIPPGGNGYVKISIKTENISGEFTKALTVRTNEMIQTDYNFILKGKVLNIVDSVSVKYLINSGNLRFKPYSQMFMDIKLDEVLTDTIFVYNASKKALNLEFKQVPKHITINPALNPLPAKTESYFIVTYDANKKNDFDFVNDRVILNTNDDLQPMKTLNIMAVIKEDFSDYSSRDFRDAPVVHLSQEKYDFGVAKQGDKVRFNLKIQNRGTDTLIIRKTKTSCGCTVSKADKTKLAAFETANVKITFNTYGRRGRQSKTVTVVTNDPDRPVVRFVITGKIQ